MRHAWDRKQLEMLMIEFKAIGKIMERLANNVAELALQVENKNKEDNGCNCSVSKSKKDRDE